MEKSIRLLVIEDSEDDALLVVSEIRKSGNDPVFKRVESEQELIESLEAEQWDLVTSDYSMPGFTGIEALKIVKKHDIDMPFILISGVIGDDIAVKAMKEGAGDYLMKDNLKRLLPAIERELEEAKTRKARKSAVNELEERERQYRFLVENIDDVIFRTDRNDFISYISPVIKSLAGYDYADLLGRSFTEIVYKDDLDVFVQRFKGLIPGVNAISEFRLNLKSGGVVWVRSSSKLSDEGDNSVGVQGVLTNISKERKLQSQLQQAQKMEAISTLAGGIAHDFNNYLTIIMGNISLARMHANEDVNLSTLLSQAEGGAQRAKTLTQQLITFSKGGLPVKEILNIPKLLRESCKFALSGSNIICNYEIGDDLPFIEADPGQLDQVISNIIINAKQSMPMGGTIKARLKVQTIEVNHVLPLTPGDYISITIQDEGTGISEDYLAKIFDPFFTTKQQGSGLGLATTFSIIKNHDGYVTADSQLGEGATFHIYLPVSDKEIAATDKVQVSDLSGHGKILVVDDEDMIQQVVRLLLEELGYEVVGAGDGVEAITLYREALETDAPFDAVILDLTMPGMGGEEAIKKLLEIDPGIKALVSSGYSNDPVMSNFSEYGFKEAVQKPYDAKTLANKINGILS